MKHSQVQEEPQNSTTNIFAYHDPGNRRSIDNDMDNGNDAHQNTGNPDFVVPTPNHISAFNRVNRINAAEPLPSLHPEDHDHSISGSLQDILSNSQAISDSDNREFSDEEMTHNIRIEERYLPLVQRIGNRERESYGNVMRPLPIEFPISSSSLPEAYPASNQRHDNIAAVVLETPEQSQQSSQPDSTVPLSASAKSFLGMNRRDLILIFYSIPLVIICVVSLTSLIRGASNTSNVTSFHNENDTSYSVNHTNMKDNSTTQILYKQSDQNQSFTCFKDPQIINILEWEAHQRGDDPSIPRTYHICSNSQINVFRRDMLPQSFDFSSGDSYPLILFRSNAHIKCGFDGSLENNCTFHSGTYHVSLNSRPFFLSYPITNATSNITIEGFKFTKAEGGANIVVQTPESSLTVKNCLFFENRDMVSNIAKKSHLPPQENVLHETNIYVQNSTFQDNTYTDTVLYSKHNMWTTVPTVGSITSIDVRSSSHPTIQIYIHDSIFYNNSFLLNNNGSHKNNEKHNSSTSIASGAIVNIFPTRKSSIFLEIKDSCFVQNKDYSSALILIGKGKNYTLEEKIIQNYSGNSFADNIPEVEMSSELQGFNTDNVNKDMSCRVSYQYEKEIGSMIRDGFTKMVIEKSCAEYNENVEEEGDAINNSPICEF